MCVVVRRELCERVQLGAKLTVIGVPTHRLTTQSQRTCIDIIMEVNCVLFGINFLSYLFDFHPRLTMSLWKWN